MLLILVSVPETVKLCGARLEREKLRQPFVSLEKTCIAGSCAVFEVSASRLDLDGVGTKVIGKRGEAVAQPQTGHSTSTFHLRVFLIVCLAVSGRRPFCGVMSHRDHKCTME